MAKEEQVEEPAQRLSEEQGLGAWKRVKPADARAAGKAEDDGAQSWAKSRVQIQGLPLRQ